jgi:uncharacterized protein
MNCPVCNVTLLIADKQGIEIDYCPKCRGVWLDRGELEKIIERTTAAYPPNQRAYRKDHDDYDDEYHDHDEHHGRKKGFLWELFD